MKRFEGVFTVLVTPFSDDGAAVDSQRMRRLMRQQIDGGVHGVIPLGSTGEFLSISRAERAEVVEACVSEAAGAIPVLIGTGAESTDDAIVLSQEAERAGADGVMIIPPFYSTPTEDELFEHYRRIGEAISIPIMIYNNPATANVDLTPPLVARLAQIDAITSIKESTLDVTRVRDIRELAGDRIDVFAGVLGYESFWLGAIGWVAVCSNVAPRESALMFEQAVRRRDADAAMKTYAKLMPLIRHVGGHRYVSATKAALEMIGLPVGPPRPPRLPLPEPERAALAADLEQLGLARIDFAELDIAPAERAAASTSPPA